MNAHQRRKNRREQSRRPSMLAHLAQVVEAYNAQVRRENEERERAERAKRLQQRVTQLQLVTAMINALGGDPEQINLFEGNDETVLTYREQDIQLSFTGFTQVPAIEDWSNIFVFAFWGDNATDCASVEYNYLWPQFERTDSGYAVHSGSVKAFSIEVARCIKDARANAEAVKAQAMETAKS